MARLDEYMRTYGSKLQSLLAPVEGGASDVVVPFTPPELLPDSGMPSEGSAQTFPIGANPSPSMQWQPHGSRVSEFGRHAPLVRSELAPHASTNEEAPASFQQQWERLSADQQKKAVDELENALKAGNQSIDAAYDEMIAQLGQRPSGKLSRQDKGMLLMEFGLALMANSRPGVSLGEAVGAAGSQALGSFRNMTRGRQQQYDQRSSEINAARAKAKSALAEKGTVEHLKGVTALERDRERRQSELERIAGTVTTEAGDIYGYTRGGQASALRDADTGDTLRARDPSPASEPLVPVETEEGVVYMTRSEARGKKRPRPVSQLSPTERFRFTAADTSAIRMQVDELFGGGMYNPITGRIAGLDRREGELKQRLLARASELYREGQGDIDHASAVEIALHEERERWRIENPPQFKSEKEAQQAFERGQIQQGDVVIVDGRKFAIGGPAREGAATGSDLPRPNTRAEFEALPPGAKFIAPDGTIRLKP